MSEQPIQPIRPAASVVIARDGDGDSDGRLGLEVLLLRRTRRAAFAGGMYVFPGGRVEGDDHLELYDAWRSGPGRAQAAQVAAFGHEWRGFWIAAIRETFEEAGLLLAYDHPARLLTWSDDTHAARFDAYRRDVHAGRLELSELCAREQLRLACDHLHFLNRWVTPLGRPRRFDTRFFIAAAPPGQTGGHDDAETNASCWMMPRRALERYAEGELGLMGVTERQLDWLQQFDCVAALHDAVIAQTEFPVHRPVLPAGA